MTTDTLNCIACAFSIKGNAVCFHIAQNHMLDKLNFVTDLYVKSYEGIYSIIKDLDYESELMQTNQLFDTPWLNIRMRLSKYYCISFDFVKDVWMEMTMVFQSSEIFLQHSDQIPGNTLTTLVSNNQDLCMFAYLGAGWGPKKWLMLICWSYSQLVSVWGCS